MRLPVFILSCGLVVFSQTALSAKFDYGQKVTSADANGTLEGVINDIKGNRYQVEITKINNTFGLQAETCTGNKSLKGSYSEEGTKIWVPEYCLKDPVAERARIANEKEAAKNAAIAEEQKQRDGVIKKNAKLTPQQKIAQEKIGTAVIGDLMWMRCFVGQLWNGNTCVGDPAFFNSEKDHSSILASSNVEFAGYSDWRLPTPQEMSSLIDCDQLGTKKVVDIQYKDKYGENDVYTCAQTEYERPKKPSLNVTIFPYAYQVPTIITSKRDQWNGFLSLQPTSVRYPGLLPRISSWTAKTTILLVRGKTE